MHDEHSDESVAVTPEQPASKLDPNAHLQLNMRVLGTHGKVLGTLDTIEQDAASGQLASLVVRHGWRKNNRTAVPASRVKWVNENSVILDLSPSAFQQLPRLATS